MDNSEYYIVSIPVNGQYQPWYWNYYLTTGEPTYRLWFYKQYRKTCNPFAKPKHKLP